MGDRFSLDDPGVVPGRYYSQLEDGRVQCDLCPRECQLRDGQRGFCFVRGRAGDQIVLTTYGRSSGFCIDPIEKKPLNHFLPGTPVLSFGTAGCNLGCKFCQNWDISKSREVDTLADSAGPTAIAQAAKTLGARSVAFTYNDPTIWLEYAVDVAKACREADVRTVAVTAGYINADAREEFFQNLDAANIDLKAFTDDFYKRLTSSEIAPILETLEYAAKETDTWIELTTLLIPGENDSDAELHKMTQWVVEHLGPNVPMHFSAFHPDFKMLNHSRTPISTLERARAIARQNGVRHAYTGNVHDRAGDTTCCPSCDAEVIVRDWYEIEQYSLVDGACPSCDEPIPGVFEHSPGTWGRRRQPVNMAEWRSP